MASTAKLFIKALQKDIENSDVQYMDTPNILF